MARSKNDKITKADLVEEIYGKALVEYKVKRRTKCPFNKEDIVDLVNSFIESLCTGLKEGKSVEIRGLGSFEKRKRSARTNMRNPRTGEAAECHEHSVVVFRSGKELKEAVWNL